MYTHYFLISPFVICLAVELGSDTLLLVEVFCIVGMLSWEGTRRPGFLTSWIVTAKYLIGTAKFKSCVHEKHLSGPAIPLYRTARKLRIYDPRQHHVLVHVHVYHEPHSSRCNNKEMGLAVDRERPTILESLLPRLPTSLPPVSLVSRRTAHVKRPGHCAALYFHFPALSGTLLGKLNLQRLPGFVTLERWEREKHCHERTCRSNF